MNKSKGIIRHMVSGIALSVLILCSSAFAAEGEAQFKDITAAEIVNSIKIGWNVGNSLDSHHEDYESKRPDNENIETLFGNPRVTEDLIDYAAENGFNAVRIPVTWYYNTSRDSEGRLQINSKWLARVKEVVDYAMANDMYVIVNSHHDMKIFYTGVDDETMAGILADADALWRQIAQYFKDYSEKLVFEAYNELANKEYDDGFRYSKTAALQMNKLNQTFVDAVRSAGGNNAKRVLMVPTLGDSYNSAVLDSFELPEDSCPKKLIVQVHCYLSKYGEDIEAEFEELDSFSQRIDAPVIIGEFGIKRGNSIEGQREKIAKNFVSRAASHGIKCFWWDDNKLNGFQLINRRDFTQSDFSMINALHEGTQGSANIIPDTKAINTDLDLERGYLQLTEGETSDGISYKPGDVVNNKLFWGATSSPVSVTPGEYRNISLKSRGDLYLVAFHSAAFYDADGQFLSGIELNKSGLKKYYMCEIPDNAASMRVCIYPFYGKVLNAQYNAALAANELELRISPLLSQDVSVSAVPFKYAGEAAVSYTVSSEGTNTYGKLNSGSVNDITFNISAKNAIDNVMMICAVYGGGNTLLKARLVNTSLKQGDNEVYLSVDVPQGKDVTAKAFLWRQVSLEPIYSSPISVQRK